MCIAPPTSTHLAGLTGRLNQANQVSLIHSKNQCRLCRLLFFVDELKGGKENITINPTAVD